MRNPKCEHARAVGESFHRLERISARRCRFHPGCEPSSARGLINLERRRSTFRPRLRNDIEPSRFISSKARANLENARRFAGNRAAIGRRPGWRPGGARYGSRRAMKICAAEQDHPSEAPRATDDIETKECLRQRRELAASVIRPHPDRTGLHRRIDPATFRSERASHREPSYNGGFLRL